MKYTIGITTFEHRFEKYFKPLVTQIKKNLVNFSTSFSPSNSS